MPFGEELYNGGRTVGMGYGAADGLRQKFTLKERDNETGLDYSINRYYSPTQGRFTSPDPMNSSGIPLLPQTWNRYAYTINNPLLYTDPKGLIWGYHDHDGVRTFTWYDTFDESVVKAAGDTLYKSQYFSNQAGTDAVYLGTNGNGRHISQDEYAAGVVDEFLRGPNSPLGEKAKTKLNNAFGDRIMAEHPEWKFWAALFGGLAGGAAEGAAKGAEGAAASGIDAEALTLTKTLEGHLSDVTKLGTKARPYGDSRLVMREIMDAGKAVPDPGGVPGGLRWDVPGAVNGSKGSWELVIDPQTSTVLHFVFKSAPKQ
jgi:RHS repeat-associated protein